MADKKDAKKPSGGGMKSDAEVLSTILAILVGLALLSALLASFQNRYAGGGRIDLGSWAWQRFSAFSSRVDAYTEPGALVTAKEKTDVWASSLRDRILGIQEKGALGRLIRFAETEEGPMWNVDFEKHPDGWVSADALKKQMSGTVARVRTWFLWLSGILSVLGAFFAVYGHMRWSKITSLHKKQMKLLEKKLTEGDIANKNERWERVEALVSSDNPGDWRVAIIEADIMLDELITSMGYDGESLGDKLKRIEQSDMTTLDAAWEAHKVRNRIAHSGSDFILTNREAKRVIGLYREALQEFDYV